MNHRLGLRTATRLRGHLLYPLLCCWWSLAATGLSEDWPQWRGPERIGVSREQGLLPSWPPGGPRLAWKAQEVGSGYAGVAVSQGLAFTIGRLGAKVDEEQAGPRPAQDLFLSAWQVETGERVWRTKIGTTAKNPSSTPTVDGDRLYAMDPDGELICLRTATGEILWTRNLVADFQGRMMSARGYGESPLIDGDRLICTPGGPEAMMVALHKYDGSTIWRSAVPPLGQAGRDGAAFSSVVVTEAAGLRQYVQLVGRGLIGVSAADGRYLWGYNPIANPNANIPTPVVFEDVVFAANGYGAGSVLLRLRAKPGNPGQPASIEAEKVYTLTGGQFQNHHGGVVLVGDKLYGGHGSNNGLPTCLDVRTGKVLWKRRGPGTGSAAVLYADGHCYFRYQDGTVALLEVSESDFRVTGTLTIPGAGADSWAHPAVANGRLFLREQDTLWVFDIRETAVAGRPLVAAESVESGPRFAKELAALAGLSATAVPAVSWHPIRAADLTNSGTLSESALRKLQATAQEKPLLLSLSGTVVSDAGLEQLRSVPHLQALQLDDCSQITDIGCRALGQLSELRLLHLARTAVTERGVENLVASPRLAALDLTGCDGIHDTATPALGRLRSLRGLVLGKTGFEPLRVSDAGLPHFAGLANLELLALDGNKVTDAGLAELARLTGLRTLSLNLLAITDAGLPALTALRSLQRLDLVYSEGFAGPKITAAGLSTLGQFSQLRELNLTGASVGDRELDRLAGLSELRTLRLLRTRVTAAGAAAWRKQFPDCEVLVSEISR